MYKSILVHIDSAGSSTERIRIAAKLASTNEAHLTGLYVIPEPRLPSTMHASFAFSEAMQSHMEDIRNEATRWKTAFTETTQKWDLQSEFRMEELHRTEMGTLSEIVALHARYEDLVIVGGGPAAEADGSHPELPADLVMTSGRPVLVVPYSGSFEPIGTNVLVCWNAGREASRAVHDSLPLLRAAETVTVLSVNPDTGTGGHGVIPGAGIALCLARHGVKVDVSSIDESGTSVADIILSRATEIGADLIVTGAYGHSRTREWVFGGVTASLLRHSAIPCLMSH